MLSEVIFDVETKKLFSEIGPRDPGDLGVSIVSLYRRKLDNNFQETEGEILSFWEEDFPKMWPIFEEANRIIGFNSIGFDVPALKPYAPSHFAKLPHFDILQKVKEALDHRLSLDAIAKETLGRTKIDVGTNAVLYWANHDSASLSKLKKYCEQDVIITKEVYDFALSNKHLLFKDKWNNKRSVDLDFSYPKNETQSNQASLF